MEFGKKIVVAVDIQIASADQLFQLKWLNILTNAEVHFVHVYQTTIMTYGMGEFCQIYPAEADRKSIAVSVTEVMRKLYEGSVDPGTKVVTRCLFDENPKEEFCSYAKEVKADTMIIFTRERHGLFDSSFAQYVARHSPCHVLILRP